jgi:transcriptional regulator
VTVIEGGRGFTEKGDMVTLCRDAINNFEMRRQTKVLEAQQAKQQVEIRDRIIREVKVWAEGKSIKKLINEVNAEAKQANVKVCPSHCRL